MTDVLFARGYQYSCYVVELLRSSKTNIRFFPFSTGPKGPVFNKISTYVMLGYLCKHCLAIKVQASVLLYKFCQMSSTLPSFLRYSDFN